MSSSDRSHVFLNPSSLAQAFTVFVYPAVSACELNGNTCPKFREHSIICGVPKMHQTVGSILCLNTIALFPRLKCLSSRKILTAEKGGRDFIPTSQRAASWLRVPSRLCRLELWLVEQLGLRTRLVHEVSSERGSSGVTHRGERHGVDTHGGRESGGVCKSWSPQYS